MVAGEKKRCVSLSFSLCYLAIAQYAAIPVMGFILVCGWLMIKIFNAVDDTKPKWLLYYVVWKSVHLVLITCALGWLLYMAYIVGECGVSAVPNFSFGAHHYYAGSGLMAVYLVFGVLSLFISHQARVYLIRKKYFLTGENFVPNNVDGNLAENTNVFWVTSRPVVAPPPIDVDLF